MTSRTRTALDTAKIVSRRARHRALCRFDETNVSGVIHIGGAVAGYRNDAPSKLLIDADIVDLRSDLGREPTDSELRDFEKLLADELFEVLETRGIRIVEWSGLWVVVCDVDEIFRRFAHQSAKQLMYKCEGADPEMMATVRHLVPGLRSRTLRNVTHNFLPMQSEFDLGRAFTEEESFRFHELLADELERMLEDH